MQEFGRSHEGVRGYFYHRHQDFKHQQSAVQHGTVGQVGRQKQVAGAVGGVGDEQDGRQEHGQAGEGKERALEHIHHRDHRQDPTRDRRAGGVDKGEVENAHTHEQEGLACGKSMTLRCIAGIERPDRGRIVVNGVTLFDSARGIDLPPQQRGVGLLFQNYALFPHMTVRENIRAGACREADRRKREARHLASLRRRPKSLREFYNNLLFLIILK